MRLAQIAVPSTALLGVSLSIDQIRLIRKYPKIVLMLDGDRTGRNAANIIQEKLQPYAQVYSIDLPDNKDPDDLSDRALISLLNKHIK